MSRNTAPPGTVPSPTPVAPVPPETSPSGLTRTCFLREAVPASPARSQLPFYPWWRPGPSSPPSTQERRVIALNGYHPDNYETVSRSALLTFVSLPAHTVSADICSVEEHLDLHSHSISNGEREKKLSWHWVHQLE